jgi:hypothetical protein
MMEVKVIQDSIAEHGARLTTLQLIYPRFIHSEVMTHRRFSRNASSSRAIPVAKMIDQVRSTPAMPLHWGKNQPGMQAREELRGVDRKVAVRLWLNAAKAAAAYADAMNYLGLHKQVTNRILEPYQWMRTIITSTEWNNFYTLRCHPDAQPEFQALAVAIRDNIKRSRPVLRPRDRMHEAGWHLPYVADDERTLYAHDPFFLAKLSTARCARVSYLKHDGAKPNVAEDMTLFDKLIVSRPIHASPCEHQAFPLPTAHARSRNFDGWMQHRDWIEAEQLFAENLESGLILDPPRARTEVSPL